MTFQHFFCVQIFPLVLIIVPMNLVQISQTIRRARLKQKLTIDLLAARTGFSKGFISRLENFRVTPSLNSLMKITAALGLNMADLFQPQAESPKVVFGSMDDGEEIVRNDGKKFGIRYFSLAFKMLDRKLDPFIIEYSPSRKQREFLMHPTDEFFLLLEGRIDFMTFDEKNSRSLQPGSTVYLAHDIPHAVRLATDCKKAKALVIYNDIAE